MVVERIVLIKIILRQRKDSILIDFEDIRIYRLRRGKILREGQNRADNIDILKTICAFLIVCIHIPFPGEIGEYFTVLTRIAVPIFFMITGYFYSETMRRQRERKQIWKILKLAVEANVLYFVWDIVLNIIKGTNIFCYIKGIFSLKNILKFIIFNDSPVGGHLWYLGALLYVLIIIFFIDKLNYRKILYWIIPILLLLDLIFGKYAIVIFNREFPFILVRNFLCVGLPYFCIGILIREKKIGNNIGKKMLGIMIILFAIMGICERAILVANGVNATRDHYISTTFLAIAVFIYAVRSSWENKGLAKIGKKYSTELYIIHPIFITVITFITKKLGIYLLFSYVGPIIVYIVSLIFIIFIDYIKNKLTKK